MSGTKTCIQVLTVTLADCFKTWAPRLHAFYVVCHTILLSIYPNLWSISKHLPFAACTVNFGPQTVLKLHRDFKNLVFGWCLVFVLGNFDHTRGGHLILWELKLLIELAPGDMVFLPSGCITHGNIPLAGADEKRYSVTWYSSGYLFRWIRAGFVNSKLWKAKDGKDFKEWYKKANAKERWSRGWNLFQSLTDLWNGA